MNLSKRLFMSSCIEGISNNMLKILFQHQIFDLRIFEGLEEDNCDCRSVMSVEASTH